MIYDKEKALEKARDLSRRIREKTEPFDPEAELAAALLEAQAEAAESVGNDYDWAYVYGYDGPQDPEDVSAALRAIAAELRGE